ncbi:phage tail protein [Paraburkholderia xenovorans]|uniref:phage tail protein n=1 Tax=Paraburkholderia xenovorans TaxID=36873 RepID=UPI0038B9A35A
MPMIFQQGQLNVAAQSAPGVLTQIVAPPSVIAGATTNGYGLVGVASWGPVNSPVLIGSPQAASLQIGPVKVRKYDVATALAIANLLGQYNNWCVRVTDGTDSAASVPLKDTTAVTPVTGATLTGFYSGTLGNNISATIAAGTKPSTFKLTLAMAGFSPEVYDNLAGTGATFWAALVSAVNNGQSSVRGPSQICVATIGTATLSPALATYTLTGGTDGTSGVTDTSLIGSNNTTPVTGMYALQSTAIQTLVLIDHTQSTDWSTIAAFCASYGIFGAGQGSAGQSIATVGAALNTAGVDTPWFKCLVGDWVYWNDTVNKQQRLVSPTLVWGPMRANRAPNDSTLNKQILGIIGTQRSQQNLPYSTPELQAACAARLDFIANPSAGGNYFSFQTDRNTSSDASTNSEAYTTMTNFLAATLGGTTFGYVVGDPQTPTMRADVKDAMGAFLTTTWQTDGFIGDVNNPQAVPYKVTLDKSNNPNNNVALGVMAALVQVTYLSIVRVFLISLQGGSTVSVDVQPA